VVCPAEGAQSLADRCGARARERKDEAGLSQEVARHEGPQGRERSCETVLAGFDRIIRDAVAIAEQPSAAPQARSSLNETEIRLMADYVYAMALA
jgi:hypothetical protein